MEKRRFLLALLLAYGALNAILYAGLLPLWDGFDEPFHYAYVARLWRDGRFPRLGATTLTAEIWESFAFTPASYLVHVNIPPVIPFNEYFAKSAEERAGLRRRLDQIDPRRAGEPGGGLNYEAQQAPLAYAALAPFDAWWRGAPLLRRILALRVLCGLVSALATGLLAWRLGGRFGLEPVWRHSAVYLAFSSQMFYAATAHVANDWLAVPLFTAVILCAITMWERPSGAAVARFALALAAGLLTKAYFLALIPFAAGLAVGLWRRGARRVLPGAAPLALAAAWYARNLAVYRDLGGMQQTVGGVSAAEVLRAAFRMPWGRALHMTAVTSFWLGNSSATLFSEKTVWLALVLALAAGILYVASSVRGRAPLAERVTIAALACFGTGLAYSAVVHSCATRGVMVWPGPWYTQPLFAPGFCLLMAGLARAGRLGRWLRVAILSVWAYVISATYVVKLIPLYAGYPAERMHAAELYRWYRGSFDDASRTLATTALLPPAPIWTLATLAVLGAVGLAAVLAGDPKKSA